MWNIVHTKNYIVNSSEIKTRRKHIVASFVGSSTPQKCQNLLVLYFYLVFTNIWNIDTTYTKRIMKMSQITCEECASELTDWTSYRNHMQHHNEGKPLKNVEYRSHKKRHCQFIRNRKTKEAYIVASFVGSSIPLRCRKAYWGPPCK